MRGNRNNPKFTRPADTPKDIARRIAARAAAEQAHRETIARFGVITAENAAEAIAFQDRRIRELTD